MKIGLVTCASMLDQVRQIVPLIPKDQFVIYPVLPCCLFAISGDTIRNQVDKSVLANEATIIIYGACHPELNGLLDMYCDSNIRKIEGNNCWEMLLGPEQVEKYLNQNSWLGNKAFLTKWNKEVSESFGSDTRNGKVASSCGIKELTVFRFENPQPDEKIVKREAASAGLPYSIHDESLEHLRNLIQAAVDKVHIENESRITLGLSPKPELIPISLLETMREIIYIIDKPGKEVTFISPIIEKLLSITTKEFKLTFLSTQNKGGYLYKKRTQIISKRSNFIADCLQRGFEDPLKLEYQIINGKGECRWIRETLSPQFKADGSIGAFAGRLEDITEWKITEQQLIDLYQNEASLRHELETQIQNRIEFTRALVHELKTPLTPIMAASDTLSSGLKQEPWLNLAQNINKGALNLNKRIDELLDLARGEIGVLQIKKIPIDCIELSSDIIQYVDAKVRKANLRLVFEHDDKTIFIEADPDRLRQVLLNLLSNAIKYTPEPGLIKLRCFRTLTDVVFQIIDSGIGISSSDRAYLFEPYHRLERDRERFDGMGLGLALSKRFVELHGGKIWVENANEHGSIFTFTIPILISVKPVHLKPSLKNKGKLYETAAN
ncbi:MAG: two-component sensor histidine kinase [Dehalococcoides mccartyi]|uniref:PAS domain-containing sensor histidine kinase n=1 Tax=Dehalococcoides mccartyi TaxID=61435 RepID=UPI0008049783|nr:ATP-binding protein [Dehalococcoides mccartyi]OBW62907.1 MAG: two-component sensor histidine kinase [Dehalococcoides mccartyi]